MPKLESKYSHQMKTIPIFWVSIAFKEESETVILGVVLEKNHAWSEKKCEQEGKKVWWINSMRRDNRLGQDWTDGTGLR